MAEERIRGDSMGEWNTSDNRVRSLNLWLSRGDRREMMERLERETREVEIMNRELERSLESRPFFPSFLATFGGETSRSRQVTPPPPVPAANASTYRDQVPAANASTYTYRLLDTSVDSIRVIILEPRPASRYDQAPGLLTLSLVHTTFESRPKYEALSYMWGNSSQTNHVLVNGKHLQISGNLYSALCHLQGEVERVIWADAICIDQSNIEERNYQIGLMPFIYSRAESVLVWLGPPSGSLQLSILKEHEEDTPEQLELVHDSLKAISLSPYWKRAWIIQEIALSMDLRVHIGSESVSWDKLMDELDLDDTTARGEMDRRLAAPASVARERIYKLNRKRKGRHGEENQLENLLEDFQSAECRDDRDKIYAFLGLANDCIDGVITADYSKSKIEIYLDLMNYFYRDARTSVPNEGRWTTDSTTDRDMRIAKFSCLAQKLLGPVYPPGLGELRRRYHWARGAIIGRIHRLGPTHHEMVTSQRANLAWRQGFRSAANGLGISQRDLSEATEAYLPRLLKMMGEDWINVCDIEAECIIFSASSWQDRETDWDKSNPSQFSVSVLDSFPFYDYPENVIPGGSSSSRMFISTGGLIGLAPSMAKEGDILCQFWNCDSVILIGRDSPLDKVVANQIAGSSIVGRVNLSTGTLDGNLRPKYQEWHTPADGTETLAIRMDLLTLALLTR